MQLFFSYTDQKNHLLEANPKTEMTGETPYPFIKDEPEPRLFSLLGRTESSPRQIGCMFNFMDDDLKT